ncbi:hypothetical protein L1994_01405 [Methanomicrobium antiquum]|uniref:Uncharacterized protein n=1 Tax=Methanomicrobium antiquum TaxID=487686 RepID=A0AAF0FS28_9EURY|nr:hypothetical protein [Methanomicrobium antiquum]WFN37081.1 hypothetical protein L1994_01405 [Methanomicrobium antiquum]
MNNFCLLKGLLTSVALLTAILAGCTGMIPDDSGVNIINNSITEDNLSDLDENRFYPGSDERIRLCSCICRLLIVENISAGEGYSMIQNYSNKNEIVMNLELYGNEPLSSEYLSFEDNPLLLSALEKKHGGVELTPEENDYALLHYSNKYFEYSGSYYVAVVREGSCSNDICYPKDYKNLKFTADEVLSLALADKDVRYSIGDLDYEVSGVCITENNGESLYQVQIQMYKDGYPHGMVIPYLNMSGGVVIKGYSYPPHILPEVAG